MSTAAGLSAQFSLSGSATFVANALGLTSQARAALAAGDWAAAVTGFSYGNLDTVTGNNGQAQLAYMAQRTVGPGATDTLNLTDGSLKTNGVAQAFTKIKMILVQIVSPDGIKVIQVGALNNANAWQGPFGGVGASNYKEVADWEPVVNHRWAGYGIAGAGAGNILSVKNPGGGALNYNILIIGR